MRRSARVDSNQADVVMALRSIGASVQPLHVVGRGCPDLLVGYDGQNWLLEVKDGSKPPSKRTLTPDEQDWHSVWQGQVIVVNDAAEAISLIQKKSVRRDGFD